MSDFIKNEVHILLKRYFWMALSALGVTNLVVLASIWLAVMSTAKSVATNQADAAVKEALDANKQKFDTLYNAELEQAKKLQGSIDDLFETLGGQKRDASNLAQQLQTLGQQLQTVNSSVRTLMDSNINTETIASVIRTIDASTNAADIIREYNLVLSQISALTNRLANVEAFRVLARNDMVQPKFKADGYDFSATCHVKFPPNMSFNKKPDVCAALAGWRSGVVCNMFASKTYTNGFDLVIKTSNNAFDLSDLKISYIAVGN